MTDSAQTDASDPGIVAVLSGGQDSSTSSAYVDRTDAAQGNVEAAVFFRYGQRHSVEEEAAKWWASNVLDVPLEILSLSVLSDLGASALVESDTDISAQHDLDSDLPASYVPGRNLLFLTSAAAFAVKCGLRRIVTGVCQHDYSGYPDCRESTMTPLQETIRAGMERPDFEIITPLLHTSKADTFAMAEDMDLLPFVLEHTHTCYEGDRTTRNEWGYGCGECPACNVRAEGWEEFRDRQ